ncbi:MAG: DUF169 domain-containing protein [Ktedonobacteraceae bacterium]
MYQELTDRCVSLLQLQHIPVGLAFVEQAPESVARTTKRVPSACTFWRLAEQDVFFALGEDHQECPIGMMTMGFQMPEREQQRAQALVETMANVQYFSPAEVSALPTVQKPHQAIVYGRMDRFPIDPDVVLCRLDTHQAMLVAEALGQVNWLQGGQAAFGRPTCGVIPRTLQSGETSMSFGCIGARTYVELTPSEMILTLPGQQFADLVEKLQTIVSANQALAPFHQQQKAAFSA